MFYTLPEEIILKIFKEVSFRDQARLAQVNQQFNRIANDSSSKLFRYKSKIKRYEVGDDICLYIVDMKPFLDKLYSTKNGKMIHSSLLYLEPNETEAILGTMKSGTLSLIEKLSSMGFRASVSANLLQIAYEQDIIDTASPRPSPKFF